MSKQLLVMGLSCPNCGDVLTEGEEIHLMGYVKQTHQEGDVWLSAVFGEYSVRSDLQIPEGATVEFRCPTCDIGLQLNTPCKLCGAPLVSVNLTDGGYIEFCSRRGCRAHALGGFGEVDQLMAIVNRMFKTPHD